MFCIGHRGAKGHAPENTIASVLKAIELGAHAVEVDVFAVEGQLIVFHDERLERTTNGSGRLMDGSLEYLRSLDAGQGQKIPTLEEVFAGVNHRACINIELKGPGTASPVSTFLRGPGARDWNSGMILVSSFRTDELERLRTLEPEVLIGILPGVRHKDWLNVSLKLKARSVHLPLRVIEPADVQKAHLNGLRIFGYTANDREEILRMKAMHVDGLFTDYPDRVLEFCPATKSYTTWP